LWLHLSENEEIVSARGQPGAFWNVGRILFLGLSKGYMKLCSMVIDYYSYVLCTCYKHVIFHNENVKETERHYGSSRRAVVGKKITM